jgi:hypothetical protein
VAQNPSESNEWSSTPGCDSVYWFTLGILAEIALALFAFDGKAGVCSEAMRSRSATLTMDDARLPQGER